MAVVIFVLLLLALVSFGLGAVGTPGRLQWTPLGLFLWVLAELIRVVPTLH